MLAQLESLAVSKGLDELFIMSSMSRKTWYMERGYGVASQNQKNIFQYRKKKEAIMSDASHHTILLHKALKA